MRKIKLNSILSITLTIAFAIILIFQLIHMSYFAKESIAIQDKSLHTHVTSLKENIEQQISNLSSVQRKIQSGSLYQFFKTPNSSSRNLVAEQLNSYDTIIGINSHIVFDEDDTMHLIMDNGDYELVNKIKKIYSENIPLTRPITTFVSTRENTSHIVYICDFTPMIVPDSVHVYNQYLGCSVIVTKFNAKNTIKYFDDENNAIELRLTSKTASLPLMNKEYISKRFTEYIRPIENTDWNIYGNISLDYYTFLDNSFLAVLTSITVIFILSLILFALIYKKYILFPINSIINFLDVYTMGEEITIAHSKQTTVEFDKIVTYMERMIKKNSALVRQIIKKQQAIYEKEISNQTYQMYMLQMQINPHFLYNTLDCISSLSFINDDPTTAEVTNKLSKILHYSITNKFITTLKDEIEMINNYFDIIKVRYPEKIVLDIDQPSSLNDFIIPRMILQPIIENSIKHNISAINKVLHISIKCYIQDDTLKIIVADDGIGVSLDKAISLNGSLEKDFVMEAYDYSKSLDTHIGINNINQRITTICGKKYGLQITGEENKFFKTTITLPLSDE